MKSALPFITCFVRKPKVDEEKQTLKKHDSLVNTEKVIDFASKLAEKTGFKLPEKNECNKESFSSSIGYGSSSS